MPRLFVPNSATIRNIRWFLENSTPFEDDGSTEAVLEFHPKWVHMAPVVLAMTAAWGNWARREGLVLRAENLGRHVAYADRMRLFEHLEIQYESGNEEHEERGRFVPLTQIKDSASVRRVIADISALLHLADEPETLSAVQYCVSELLRNVLEHSGSPDGAFVCAHRYIAKKTKVPRVTLAVADCGRGIADHLARAYPEVATDEELALQLALQPGITGAVRGPYGAPENAGAGLFMTRSIAKGSGGYFLVISGRAGYRLRRGRDDDEMSRIHLDPFDDPRADRYPVSRWRGTVVSVEIRTEKILDYEGLFEWIRRQVPRKSSSRERIKFT